MTLIRRLSGTVVVFLLCAVALTACGSHARSVSTSSSAASASTSPPPAGESAKVAALVPAEVKAKGKLVWATDATYPPMEFTTPDGKTIIGMDADIARAVSMLMGLQADLRQASFDSIIPGLQAKQYDISISAFFATKQREQVVDMVSYYRAGTAFFAAKGSHVQISGLYGLCGHKVAVLKGTTYVQDVTKAAQKCTGAKPQVLEFPDNNAVNLALLSGRADVGMSDGPVVASIVKTTGKFRPVGQAYGITDYGIAVPKGDLAKPVEAAVQELIDSGQYRRILDKWGVAQGAISSSQINP